jgi:hypothetical protein
MNSVKAGAADTHTSRAISGHEPSQDSCTLLSIDILTWPARGSTRD